MNKSEYVRVARAAVCDFEEKGVSLNDSVKSAAADMSLNTEQTKRLVEFTNTIAHLHLFDKRAEDKYIQFELADPDAVLASDEGPCACAKVASVDDPSDFFLPLEVRQPMMEKVASDEAVEERQPMPLKHRQHMAMRLSKLARELDIETQVAHSMYLDGVSDLAFTLRRTNAEEKLAFVKSVRSMFPDAADNVLTQLDVADPAIEVSHEKTASSWPIESDLTRTFAGLVESRQHVIDAGRGYKYVADRIGV